MTLNPTPTDTTDEVDEALTDHELATIKKKSVHGVLSFVLRTALLNGIGIGAAFFLSAYLTPEDFGIYGFVTQIIGLLVFFSDVGLAASLVQKKTEPTLHDYRTAFTVQQILSWLIVALVGLILLTGIVQQKTGSVGVWILVALALSFPLASLKTISSIMLERKLEFSKQVLPQIIEQLVFQGILVFLAWKHFGALAYAYAIIARSILGSVVMWLIKPWSIGLAIDRGSLKALLGFGLKFQLNDFLARIKDQLFFLMLGFFLPLREFGYIQWAKTWSMYPYSLTVQNVMQVTFPTFSRLQGNKEALGKAIEKSIFFITLFIFPILVGMCLFIQPLMTVVPRYQQWQPAALSFVLFTLSIAWAAISTPLTNTLNAVGEINKTLKLMMMWTLLTWILTPVGIWWLGFNGVALMALVISFTSFLPALYVKRIVSINVTDQVWRQLVSVVAMAGVGVVGLSLWSSSLVMMGAGFVATGATYLGMMLLIGRRKLVTELQSLRS